MTTEQGARASQPVNRYTRESSTARHKSPQSTEPSMGTIAEHARTLQARMSTAATPAAALRPPRNGAVRRRLVGSPRRPSSTLPPSSHHSMWSATAPCPGDAQHDHPRVYHDYDPDGATEPWSSRSSSSPGLYQPDLFALMSGTWLSRRPRCWCRSAGVRRVPPPTLAIHPGAWRSRRSPGRDRRTPASKTSVAPGSFTTRLDAVNQRGLLRLAFRGLQVIKQSLANQTIKRVIPYIQGQPGCRIVRSQLAKEQSFPP